MPPRTVREAPDRAWAIPDKLGRMLESSDVIVWLKSIVHSAARGRENAPDIQKTLRC